MVRVKMFAAGRQLAGQECVEVDLPEGATVAELRTRLGQQIPALEEILHSTQIAVDHEYAGDDVTLTQGSEIACIPPVSGG